MGANCCIAAKESSQPSMAPVEVSTYRVRHSPSWSFRWDNRTHIEDIMENSTVFSNQSSGNIHPEVKNSFITPTEGHNSGDSHSDVLCRVKWQKSDKKMEASKLSKFDPPGIGLKYFFVLCLVFTPVLCSRSMYSLNTCIKLHGFHITD